jgi:hypothetical protein
MENEALILGQIVFQKRAVSAAAKWLRFSAIRNCLKAILRFITITVKGDFLSCEGLLRFYAFYLR